MSLREDLDILLKAYRKINLQDVDNPAQLVKNHQNTLQALLTTISKHLPEKYIIQSETDKEGRIYEGGYNFAIDEVNKLLTTQKGSEG